MPRVVLGLAIGLVLSIGFTSAGQSRAGVTRGATGSYDNALIADTALKYKGQWGGNACSDAKRSGLTGSQSSYPVAPKRDASGKAVTDGDGQCRAFVNCIVWMASGGKQWLGGTYFGAFLREGATEIKSVVDLVKGDIVQSGDGIHTSIIVRKISDAAGGKPAVFNVVDSNHDYKETVLNYDRSIVLDASNRAFRLGSVAAGTQSGLTNGKIAFQSYRAGNWDVYSMNANGSNQKNLTNSPGDDAMPDWSLAGKIAYGRDTDKRIDIFVMNADGSGRKNITSTMPMFANRWPSWSPDGKTIAFVGTRRTSPTKRSSNIYVLNQDGTRLIMVTHFRALGAWLKPSWSPDGKRLVFTVNRHGGEGGSPNVYVVGINGSSAPTKITGKGVDEEPSWSSDGERIVFARASANNNHNVFVMNADGSHQIRLTGSTTDDTSPMWSPDGTQIVFTRTRGRDWDIPTGDIYVMDTDGSNIRRLTRTRNNAGPSWQPVRR